MFKFLVVMIVAVVLVATGFWELADMFGELVTTSAHATELNALAEAVK